MTPKKQELLLNVMDGQITLAPILHKLDRYNDCEKFLKWLLINNIKGENLIDWIKVLHNNSIMNMVKYIIMVQQKNKELKPIILGKDWK